MQVVSRDIRRVLTQRADHFNIVLDDVSITQLTFGREYTHAIEAKQVAQQEAERAKFIVSPSISIQNTWNRQHKIMGKMRSGSYHLPALIEWLWPDRALLCINIG